MATNIFASYNLVQPPEGEQLQTIDIPTIEDYNPVAQQYVDNYTLEEEIYDNPFDNNPFIMNKEKIEVKPPLKKGHKVFSGKTDFIETMKPIYKSVLKSKGLNENYADYLVAQSALESGWGKHQSGKNNFGGIKGKGTVKTTKEFINGKYVTIKDNFRDFDSLRDYAEYHVNLLNNSRYKAFNGNFISNVVKGGYATDPSYASKLLKMYKSVIG